jgi:hypothetical protein
VVVEDRILFPAQAIYPEKSDDQEKNEPEKSDPVEKDEWSSQQFIHLLPPGKPLFSSFLKTCKGNAIPLKDYNVGEELRGC